MSPMFRTALYEGLGSRRMYGTGTCDTMNKFRVNGEMYGAPMRLMYPDVEHTSFMMVDRRESRRLGEHALPPCPGRRSASPRSRGEAAGSSS